MGSVEQLLANNNADFSMGLLKLKPILDSMLKLDTLSLDDQGNLTGPFAS